MVVENFAVLSIEEQIKFARPILEKINNENIFSDETNFEFQDVEPDDITGGLWITVSTANPIRVIREATWTAGTEEGAEEDPGNDAEYSKSIYEDTNKSFKTLSSEIDGYDVSLKVDDVEEDETVDADIEIDHISHEDAGIGSYEYFGFTGYDSQPYVEVEGTITRMCDCNITFFVIPTVLEEVTPEVEDI